MCESCGKPKCNCGKDTCSTGAAVVIKNATEYVNFRKVLVPASVRSDETDPPKPGEFCNVLLVFEVTGNAYMYSSDGVPTQITDKADIKRLENLIEAEAKAREDEDKKLAQAIVDESNLRSAADSEIWQEIETIEASSDVVDVVGTYAELQAYDTSKLHDKDLIKVLQDETHDDAITYYRWSTSTDTFTYVGAEGPYYTASETDALLAGKQNTLTAGSNITIVNDVISATAEPLQPATTTTLGGIIVGNNLSITANGTLSADAQPAVLYPSTGQNTDGAMTQKATTDALTLKADSSSLATVATSGSYNDLSNKPTIPTIPTNTSAFTNDGSDGTSVYVEADELATVATTGSYTDLLNKPTIPAAQVNSDWNANSGVAEILNKPNLAAVATSGSYTDLSNTPTIPATNNINSNDWNALWQ